MAKEVNNTQQENAPVNKQDILKLLGSAKDKLLQATSSRELSLSMRYLDNAIYWLKADK